MKPIYDPLLKRFVMHEHPNLPVTREIVRVGGGGSSTVTGFSPATVVIAEEGSGLKADYYLKGGSDNEQLQNAYNYLKSKGGGSLFVNAKDLYISATVKLPSNTRTFMRGPDITTVHNAAGARINLFENDDLTNGNSNIHLEGFTIDGDKAHHTSSGNWGRGVFFSRVTKGTIRKVNAFDCSNRAADLSRCIDCVIDDCIGLDCGSFQEQNFTFQLCTRSYFKDCIASGGTDQNYNIAYSTDCGIFDCVSYDSSGAGLGLFGSNANGMNNRLRVDGFISVNDQAGIRVEQTKYYQLVNIYIIEPDTYGIADFGTHNIMVDAILSNIYANGNNISTGSGITLEAPRTTYSNVKVEGFAGHGMRILGADAKLSTCIVNGSGLNCFIVEVDRVSLMGCEGKNGGKTGTATSDNGLRIEGSYCSVIGGSYYDDQSVKTQAHGIREISGDYNSIVGVNVVGNNSEGIVITGTNTQVVANPDSTVNQISGYLKVGVNTTLVTTADGDVLGKRLTIGATSGFSASTGRIVKIESINTAPSGTEIQESHVHHITPTINSSGDIRLSINQTIIDAATGVTQNSITSGIFENRVRQDGLISTLRTVNANAMIVDSSSPGTTQITTLSAFNASVYSRSSGSTTAAIDTGVAYDTNNLAANGGLTITNLTGFMMRNPAANTITNLIGIDIEALTRGSVNIGLRIAKANTYSLQLSDTGGTASGGITFGTDTQVYRSAANVLTFNTVKLSGIVDPTAAQDAATKNYVDGNAPTGLFDHFVDVNNSGTSETDLYSDTLIAGRLASNGDKVIAQYGGQFVGDATSTQRLKVYFAGTLIFDSGALGIGVTAVYWNLLVTIIRESASIVRCTVALNTSFATLNAYATYTKITGLTLANTQIVKITGTAAGVTGASNQITASEGYVEFKPAA